VVNATADPPSRPWRISRRKCLEGTGKAVPDLVKPGLRVLFVGINPSNCSGASGFHFATLGNRLWPAIPTAGVIDGAAPTGLER
jgi:double-stranded uracil-DNA glycosylase